MPSFDELVRNLLHSGLSEQDVVSQIECALRRPVEENALADDLESVREWAVHAGWEPSEVDRALLTLSKVCCARLGIPGS